jgi:ArsR family transcriptional regulator
MDKIKDLFRVLGDETRLRLIHLLMRQDLCVCELVDILDLPQPKISKHIAKLRAISLVNTRRNEQYIYYSFNNENKDYKKILDAVMSIENEILRKDLDNLNNTESFVCSKEV